MSSDPWMTADMLCTQSSVSGIKTNIPNTVSVLGILFHKKNIPGIRDIISIIKNGIRDIIPGPRWNILLGIIYLLSNRQKF